MIVSIFNPLSGKNSVGLRFRFRVRAIARQNLYLPLAMRELPQIQDLLKGVSPLDVFGCGSIHAARCAFYALRKKYDFPYWAAIDFKVQNINDSMALVPLRLNRFQYYLTDILIRRNIVGFPARYVISKTIPRCGLTTCVQAYILWRQLFWHPDHSLCFAPDAPTMARMKDSVVRMFPDRFSDMGSSSIVALPHRIGAFFGNFYSPHALDGIPGGFIHLADMSKWQDIEGEVSERIFANAERCCSNHPESIVILEGDRPSDPAFDIDGHRNYLTPKAVRTLQLQSFTSNPFFLNKIIYSTDSRFRFAFHHIDLNKTVL